jgi:hypothetical protein
LRSHDTINDKTGASLKIFYGSFSRRTEDAVDNQPEVWSSTQRTLEAANGFTGRSSRYGWLTRIWHMHSPLIASKRTSARHAARFGFPNTSKQRF